MKIKFLGHSAFLLQATKAAILIDPFLTGNPVAKQKPENIKCDFIILTHGHGDHIGDAVSIAKRNDATIIGTYEVATWCGGKGAKVHAMNLGGARNFTFGRVKLTIAHHSSGFNSDKGMVYMGDPAGVLLSVDDKTIYHSGDTGLFYDMKLIGEMNAIDVALLPIGDNFTMGIDDAVKAVEFLNPKLAIPMHFNTFDVIRVNPQEFVRKVEAIGKKAQILEVDGEITV